MHSSIDMLIAGVVLSFVQQVGLVMSFRVYAHCEC
jgi:hypothetical protein